MSVSISKLQTINDAKHCLTAQFRAAGIDSADIDARLLLMHGMGLTRAGLIASAQDVLSPDAAELIQGLAARRIKGEPVDNILAYREFYGRRFKVTQDVLSPRPETEMLVEAALEIFKTKPTANMLDLGTGSGAIIISVLTEALNGRGTAIDMSEAALDIARQNAKTHKLTNRIEIMRGEWFAPVKDSYDIIISNPPYITQEAMETLAPEVINFDPPIALSGGEDGLSAYREIISKAKGFLKPGGEIIFEIGFDQAKTVTALLTAAGFSGVSTHKDLAGHDRMIRAR